MNGDKNMSVGDGTVMVEDKIVFTGCKHAYLVMAHKDDETLRTLLRTLDDPRNDIFIHMDAKNTGWDKTERWLPLIRRESFSFPVLASHGEATRKSPVSLACSTPLLTRGVTPTITF